MVHATPQLFKSLQSKSIESVWLPRAIDTKALDYAISFLEAARRQRPGNLLVYRMLIESYVAQGDWLSALTISNQTPKSLKSVSHGNASEIAIPYFHLIGLKDMCGDVTSSEIDNLRWFIKNKDDLRYFANTLLYQGQPLASRGAYCAGNLLYGAADSRSDQFRDSILAIMSRKSKEEQYIKEIRAIYPSFLPFTIDGTSLTIFASQFRWMTEITPYDIEFGTPLAKENSTEGVFWWNGQATAVISVEQSGLYLLEAAVKNSMPAPVKMELGVDGSRLSHFELLANDNSWQTVQVETTLENGLHTIDVWFLNDAMIDGKDRDGAIRWLKIRPIKH